MHLCVCTEFTVRDLGTSDFEKLKQSHKVLPIGYDNDFFVKVCGKEDLHFGLCSEAAQLNSTLAGFATARQVGVDRLCYNDRRALTKRIPVNDTTQLVYVLTIGVDPECRRRRLAHTLMQGIVRVCSCLLHATSSCYNLGRLCVCIHAQLCCGSNIFTAQSRWTVQFTVQPSINDSICV